VSYPTARQSMMRATAGEWRSSSRARAACALVLTERDVRLVERSWTRASRAIACSCSYLPLSRFEPSQLVSKPFATELTATSPPPVSKVRDCS
jgi:hypothetical protein